MLLSRVNDSGSVVESCKRFWFSLRKGNVVVVFRSLTAIAVTSYVILIIINADVVCLCPLRRGDVAYRL